MSKRYSFVEAEVPVVKSTGRKNINREIVVNFIATGMKTAKLTGPWKNLPNKAIHLRKAARDLGFSVTVRCTDGAIYMINDGLAK